MVSTRSGETDTASNSPTTPAPTASAPSTLGRSSKRNTSGATPARSRSKSKSRASSEAANGGTSTSTAVVSATGSVRRARSSVRGGGAFKHAPNVPTLAWMAISLPLVAWDTIYVLGRPYTMEGGWLHWPMYVPYVLYGNVDHVYGWKAFNARNGFTGAQGLLNLVEEIMYFAYIWLCFSRGTITGGKNVSILKKKVTVAGRPAAAAILLGFSAAVMTLSKTVLYWANEYFSGFDNIGHNTPLDLLFLWIIPNGAWLVGSAYMIYALGNNILDGLAPPSRSKSD